MRIHCHKSKHISEAIGHLYILVVDVVEPKGIIGHLQNWVVDAVEPICFELQDWAVKWEILIDHVYGTDSKSYVLRTCANTRIQSRQVRIVRVWNNMRIRHNGLECISEIMGQLYILVVDAVEPKGIIGDLQILELDAVEPNLFCITTLSTLSEKFYLIMYMVWIQNPCVQYVH